MLVLVGVRPSCLTQPQRIEEPPGQAPGPYPAPHPPLVPTGRGPAPSRVWSFKTSRTGPHHSLLRVSNIIRTGNAHSPFGRQHSFGGVFSNSGVLFHREQTNDFETTHPQQNEKEATSFISKVTVMSVCFHSWYWVVSGASLLAAISLVALRPPKGCSSCAAPPHTHH